jgi:hypothetical protein
MKNICVYCGSRKPKDPEIAELAVALGRSLPAKNLGLVYGGGKVGMMGLVADAALSEGGEVIGVIPTALKRAEVVHTGLTDLHETQDMHTRKALMESLSDAFVVLPGGFGTLDEFFEILTWRQLGIHDKPIILVNKNGYFDGLQQYLKTALSEDFIRQNSLDLFHIAHSLEECLEMLELDLGLH